MKAALSWIGSLITALGLGTLISVLVVACMLWGKGVLTDREYEDIRANLQQTFGEAVPTIHELTWRYVLAAVLLLMIAWALGLWWLRGPL